ncbi:LCP family protein, partial [Candidatus Daviesbacteria bacterium]|nr:LCP family protein [Candidatus Daviesbacteria bacterium]
MEQLRRLDLGKDKKNQSLKTRKVKKTIKGLAPFVVIIVVLTSLAIFLTTLSGSNSYVSYIFSGTGLKSTDNRVNVLLLGIAGGLHDGANLTDTIMVASYNLKTNQLFLFSIPRDLWLPSLKSKANAVYEIGSSQNNGLGLSKTVMGNILGIPVHYALRVDFRGFVKALDVIDGIDVLVEKSFDDYQYPIQGKEGDLCGFEEKEIDFDQDQAKKLNIEPGK